MNCAATALTLTHEDPAEKTLVKIGKPATTKLIQALSDTGKTVITHIILTQIWGDEADKDNFSTKYIYKECNQLIGWHHTYNGLVWEWFGHGGYVVRQVEVDKVKNYWAKKLIDKQNASLDFVQISEELYRQDSVNFPCTKTYENNSAGIKYEVLQTLLSRQSSDTLFTALWNQLGNDSTMNVYNDCFFVTYRPDGLSFRFNTDRSLRIIFIEAPYKGELPCQIKIGDKKKTVEKTLGRPNKRRNFKGNSWSYYTDKNLTVRFGKAEKVTQCFISKE